jgi:quinol monooxygenase YgiN
MITVIATVQLRPGCRDAYLERLARLVPLVAAEAGCLGYRPHVDLDAGLPRQATDPDQVILVEQWRGLSELQAHLAAPHMVAYREEVAAWVESVSLRVMTPA